MRRRSRRHHRGLERAALAKPLTLDEVRCRCATPKPERCTLAGILIEPPIYQCSKCLCWVEP